MIRSSLRLSPLAALLVLSACTGASGARDAAYAQRQYAIGERFHVGHGVPMDLDRARAGYRAACEAGSQRGCAALAHVLVLGPREGLHVDEALTLARGACEAGEALGCTNLALAMTYASNDERDPAEETELHRRACDAGEPVGCRRLGRAYQDGTGVDADDDRAIAIYRDACDRLDGRACAYLGAYYRDGESVADDDAEAMRLFRRACELDSGLGCVSLGDMITRGEGIDVDLTAAYELFVRACDHGESMGCNYLGWAIREGLGVEEDPERGFEVLQRACDLESSRGCNNVGSCYEQGIGVERDVVRAAHMYADACDMGDDYGCTNLARLYARGEVLAQDVDHAARLYELGCARGDDGACDELDELEGEPPAEDVDSLTQACEEEGDLDACAELGLVYQFGSDVEASIERAMELYRRSCDGGGGSTVGCGMLAQVLHETDPTHGREATELFQLGCDEGIWPSCVGVARILERGALDVPRDPERARTILEPICEDGFEDACGPLAHVLVTLARDAEMGLAGGVDRARAERLYAKACELNPDGTGCFQRDLLRGTPSDDVARFEVQLTRVEHGPTWLRRGARCTIDVERRPTDESARVRIVCIGRPVYPTASWIHWTDDGGLVDTEMASTDTDARITLDARARTFDLEDDATGILGAIHLVGRVTALPR